MNTEFMVSVAVLTYNHARTIQRCLDSVCNQQSSYNFEVVVHDDASSDDTPILVQEYAMRSSVKITLIQKAKNVGCSQSFYDLLGQCSGKYVALCEGDDYWIDESKLETQVEFMESNQSCILCHHRVFIETKTGRELSTQSGEVTGNNRLRRYFASSTCPHTCSMMIRNCVQLQNPPERFRKLQYQDAVLTLMCCTHGELRFIDKIMSVYSFTGDGLYSGATDGQRLHFLLEFNQTVIQHYPQVRYSWHFISTYVRQLNHYWQCGYELNQSVIHKVQRLAGSGPIGIAYYCYIRIRQNLV